MNISPVTYREVSGWLRKHVAVVSMIVFLCSCSVRLFLAERADPRDVVVLYSDAVGYLAPAASLVERGAFLNSTKEPMVDRTPGYPMLIATLMLLVGRDLHKILLAQAFVLSLTPAACLGLQDAYFHQRWHLLGRYCSPYRRGERF